MMSRKLTNRERVLMLILALLLIFGAYYLVVLRPVSETLSSAENTMLDMESALILEEAKAERLSDMEAALDALKAEAAETAEIALYDNTPNVVRTLNQALAAAEDYNLIFGAVTFSEHLAIRPIDMTFTCASYTDARDIVAALYASPYRCAITALNFTPELAEDDTSEHVPQLTTDPVSVRLSLTFYEYVEQAVSATA